MQEMTNAISVDPMYVVFLSGFDECERRVTVYLL